MHAISFLSRWLRDCTVVRHCSRALALMKAVQALVICGKLSLTHLGRQRQGSAHVKHHIRAIDRLLGNCYLHQERDGIYRAIAATLLRCHHSPVLIVDWADFELRRQWVMIKAAVPVGGRAVNFRRLPEPLMSRGARQLARASAAKTSPGRTEGIASCPSGPKGWRLSLFQRRRNRLRGASRWVRWSTNKKRRSDAECYYGFEESWF